MLVAVLENQTPYTVPALAFTSSSVSSRSRLRKMLHPPVDNGTSRDGIGEVADTSPSADPSAPCVILTRGYWTEPMSSLANVLPPLPAFAVKLSARR